MMHTACLCLGQVMITACRKDTSNAHRHSMLSSDAENYLTEA